MSLADIRREYSKAELDESSVDADPIKQFERWMNDALSSGLLEPTAVVVATASAEGAPTARVMLLKGVDARGFVFYSNYQSVKGEQLEANPRAALVFFWPELERQVRITGSVARTSAEESDEYFRSRPRTSQLGAWVSHQSQPVSKLQLVERFALQLAKYLGRHVPRPPHWGGYRLTPEQIEFWQGRPSRLHDRMRYRLDAGAWVVERLSP